MDKAKVAVLGGGMAGLTAAYELTRPALAGRYDVTVYTLGWRLGGKLASGRGPNGRNQEHGLHVWFGFYDNAFALLDDCYRQLNRKWLTVMSPRSYIPCGHELKDRWSYLPILLPEFGGTPGDGEEPTEPWSIIERLLDRMLDAVAVVSGEIKAAGNALKQLIPDFLQGLDKLPASVFDKVQQLWAFVDRSKHDPALESEEAAATADAAEVCIAIVKGLFKDGVFDARKGEELEKERGIMRLNQFEFSQWLIAHGANVNARGPGGWTAAHFAAQRNTGPKTLQLLVDNRADLNARDDDGLTPLDIAKENGKSRLVEWILRRVDSRVSRRKK